MDGMEDRCNDGATHYYDQAGREIGAEEYEQLQTGGKAAAPAPAKRVKKSVIPAQAGSQESVIPAQAGIQEKEVSDNGADSKTDANGGGN
jgi:hypothetical protein